jgi:hypothetical protein
LQTLEKEFLGVGRVWRISDVNQLGLFGAYRTYGPLLERIKDFKAKASTEWMELNAFLESEKFAPMFDGPLNGIGVVSILDKLVKWLEAGTVCQIKSQSRGMFPGFELASANFLVHATGLGRAHLVEMLTQSDDRLFLMMSDRELTGLRLFEFADHVMHDKRKIQNPYASVQLPKIDFDLKPDISFLVGAGTTDERGDDWFVAQARQQFKFRMNEHGARAKVATGVGMMRCMVREEPKKLIFDQPFVGWFAQKDSTLPLAVFHADYDSWREPAGSLEEL